MYIKNTKFVSQGNSMLYNERRAVILPPKMPLWHSNYFEIQLLKKVDNETREC